MYCISINYKNTPAEVRNRFALTESGQRELAENLRDMVSGCVILSTCNRIEVYYTGEDCNGRLSMVEDCLAGAADVSATELRRYSMNYGSGSVLHLCRVACGMDSMVLGEVEIIRQIKDAYLMSRDMNLADGEINQAFQGALACAKEAATCGAAVRLPLSVGTLCAREAVRFCREKYADRAEAADGRGADGAETADEIGIDRPLADGSGTGRSSANILVVGATGRIGSIIVKDIADMAPDIELIGTSRSHGTGGLFQSNIPVKMYSYADRYEIARRADVIISATTAPHYTFTADRLTDTGSRLFIDLAMPRDIDPAVADIGGCVLRDIDYIHTLAYENNESRRNSMAEMEPYVMEKADEIKKNIALSGFFRENGDLMERIRENGGDRLVYEMKDTLDCDAFKEMLDGLLSVYD